MLHIVTIGRRLTRDLTRHLSLGLTKHLSLIAHSRRRESRLTRPDEPRILGDAPPVTFRELRATPAKRLRAILAGDPAEAARWVYAAARHGLPEAQLTLGQMLLDANGVRRDHAAAIWWFRRAAAAGLADAMNMVGRCHELGWGVAADPLAAASWYRRAAERGLDWGQYNLANLLLQGNGVSRDRAAALAWYRRAAAQGHAKSMNVIGRFLEEGWEVRRDPEQALAWYRAAAEAGDFRGQFNLATVLAHAGRLDEAERWFRLAIDSCGTSFPRAAGQALLAREEPELRALGWLALSRAAHLASGTGDARKPA